MLSYGIQSEERIFSERFRVERLTKYRKGDIASTFEVPILNPQFKCPI